MEVSGQLYSPTATAMGKSHGIRSIVDCVGLRACLELLERRQISCRYRGSKPKVVNLYCTNYLGYHIAATTTTTTTTAAAAAATTTAAVAATIIITILNTTTTILLQLILLLLPLLLLP